MTMRQRTINNLIEISPQADGSFLTQAFPTNFHQFYTKKLLTPQESVSDYKEVTAAEKANIINADSQWVEPSKELLAETATAGIAYNPKTGYFEYNTLVDITTEELRDMLLHINEIFLPGGKRLANSKARTNIVTASSLPREWGGDFVSLNGLLVQNNNIEILKLGDVQAQGPTVTIFCYHAYRLKKILGEIDVRAVSGFGLVFKDTPLLSDITLWSLKCSIAFSGCPLLSLTSIQYMVDNAANTSPITITLHPDAYARLTDELIAQAAEKQITFATTS